MADVSRVTFRSHELHTSSICEAVAELGYKAEIRASYPARREPHVAKVQVMANI